MRYIYQKLEQDCGVAALAMLSDVSYEEAHKFFQLRYGRTSLISSGKVLDGIRHFGRVPCDTMCRAIKGRKLYDLDCNALLSGQLIVGQKRVGHWAVWDAEAQAIRDPYGFEYPFLVERLVEIAWPE